MSDAQPLAAALAALDALLAIAIDRQARRLGPESLLDPWRGMHLDANDARSALAAPAPDAIAAGDGAVDVLGNLARRVPEIGRAADWLGLANADLAIVLLALAPDVDLRYERVYAYLQDDVTRKRPSSDLAANLFCSGAAQRLTLLGRLSAHAPLGRAGVLDNTASPEVAALARPLVLDTLWRNHLLHRDDLDAALAGSARLKPVRAGAAPPAFLDPGLVEELRALAHRSANGTDLLRVVLCGPHGAGKARVAEMLAAELGLGLLLLDLRDAAAPADIVALVDRARKFCALAGALLYVHGLNRLAQRDLALARALVEALAASSGWFVLSLDSPWPTLHAPALHARTIALDWPDAPRRAAAWRAALAAHRIEAAADEVERVAARFRLSPAQIDQAVMDVALRLPAEGPRTADERSLAAAARALCGEELSRLAHRVHPRATFAGLVTSTEVDAQLHEICARMACRDTVRREWTRDCVHARNAGVTALFAGPSGTGKTFAAEVVANELGLDLFRIDLAAVVSKYIGETEKNLDRVFAAAESANAVLFFDEADALFGKRSEVKDAHDRYANIEIAYLLQKMEQFDGLAILATNLKQNLDEAFARRLTFSVNFAFPEAPERARLWRALWPPNAPIARDVDLAWFANEYALSGGNIRNTVLAAVYLAAANGREVTREHLLHATRREYQKLGKHLAAPAAAPRVHSA